MNSVAASPMNPQTDIHSSRVLILDFGAQYTQLIARRVREQGVFCEILPWDVTNDDVRKWKPKGIILSGGPESVTDQQPPRAPQVVFELGVPVLGICYGMQTMAQQLGGRVVNSQSSRVRLCRSHEHRAPTNCSMACSIARTTKAAACSTCG